MTHEDLAISYLKKIEVRAKVLQIYLEEGDYSDVVRESQELVELAIKGILRKFTIDPPKLHDVGKILLECKNRFNSEDQLLLEKIADASKWLRKERELSMYGEIDFIPSEEYTLEEANRAIESAIMCLNLARKIIKKI